MGDSRTDLLIVVVVCPGRHVGCVSRGKDAKRAAAKEGYLVASQAHVWWRRSCLNSRAWQVKDGALSQRKATNQDNKRSRRVATTVFIHSAPLPQHEPLTI